MELINYCELRDLGFVGPKFTWLFQQRDGLQIRERLDRALGNIDWLNIFSMETLYHLSSSTSNHSPLFLHFKNRPSRRRKRKLFRFESMWLNDTRCKEVVKEAWEERELVGSD